MPTDQKINKLKGERFFRTIAVDRSDIDQEARTVSLAFSSEEPVARWYGVEVLDHAPASVRLGRLNSGGPLLVDHDETDHVGVVEAASIGPDKVARATVRLGRSARATEIFQDIIDGIRNKISVGYRIHTIEQDGERDGLPLFRAKDWEPVEISLVAVPADNSVGVGRSENNETSTPMMEEESENNNRSSYDGDGQNKKNNTEVRMNEEKTTPSPEEVLRAERDRVGEIEAVAARFVGRVPNMGDLKSNAVRNGWSAAQFKGAIADAMPAGEPLDVSQNSAGLSNRESAEYSISRAVLSMVPGSKVDASLEREASDEIARKLGREARGFFIPHEIQKRAVLTAGTANVGGNLVATNLQAGSYIEALRNKMLTMQLGVQVLPGLVGNVAIPKLTGTASAYWVTEDAALTSSNPTFGQVTLTPKTVGAYVDVSRQLMLQSTPAADQIVTNDLTTVLALAIDKAILQGSGSAGQPTGIVNTASLTSASNASFTWAMAVTHETNVNAANANLAPCAYVTTPSVLGALKSKVKETGYPTYMVEEGQMNGYPIWATGQMPSGNILFGDFTQVLLGEYGTLDLTVDPYKNSDKGTVRIIGFNSVDVAVRQIAAFSLGTSFS